MADGLNVVNVTVTGQTDTINDNVGLMQFTDVPQAMPRKRAGDERARDFAEIYGTAFGETDGAGATAAGDDAFS